MLQLKNLSKIFTTETIETTALNKINLDIEDGDFVSIMGSSGSGKSTLLNIIGMLDSPSSGKYIFGGKEIEGYSESKLSTLRSASIGFIFQNFNLIDELTVRENIELPLFYQKVSAKKRRIKTLKIIEQLNIDARANHFPIQLSGGQQQRVAVARALVTDPKLILADEPTGNLDSKNGKEVMDLLVKLNKAGSTIVMVTHSKEHADYASRIVELSDGIILQ